MFRLICLFPSVIPVLIFTALISEECSAVQAPPESGQSTPHGDDSFSPQGPYFGQLVIPDIVRYQELPMRMHLEPTLAPLKIVNGLDERLVPLFARALTEGSDLELQTVAAMSLARVPTFEGLSIESVSEQIIRKLKTSTNTTVLYASAMAAANGNIQSSAPDLIRLADQGNDSQKLMIEPALIRWKTADAKQLWMPRLDTPGCTDVVFRLAAEGVAAIGESAAVSPLSNVVADEAMSFGKRFAACKAVAILDPVKAINLSERLTKGDEHERLLAVALLDNAVEDAWPKVAALCPDPASSVSSNAWKTLLVRRPELLLDHLPIGRTHVDSTVRISAARTMKLFPTPERCSWLNELLNDAHLHVRNVARQMLVEVALHNEGLYQQVVSEAANKLKPENTNWQGIEQSLILLGEIRSVWHSALCFPLLKYPRDEVGVSAAWLIHLFPDDGLRSQLLAAIQEIEKDILNTPTMSLSSPLKQQHLLQAGALLRLRDLMPLLESKFSKAAPGGLHERSAAMWAIGLLNERNPDPSLVRQFEGRIVDRSSIPPEAAEVRRASVMALGLMRSKSSLEILEESYRIDPAQAFIPQTVRFVMPLIGEPIPPEIPEMVQQIGGWKITPPDP
ncbi:MAG: HEAT repeat domain-containing protein [Planctomycetota bacterium]